MKSAERRVGRVEGAQAASRRIHTFFRNPGETQEMVQAQIREKIASGEASPTDQFVTFFWRAPDGEE
jgi:hypothetical protein